jgi:ABC-type multidrug transport system fused ATPase/permease subunit
MAQLLYDKAQILDYIFESDKVLVVDHGSVVEFDRSFLLLSTRKGLFYNMYKLRNIIDR